MTTILGINASPRKKANTHTLVETILDAAAENGAQTRQVNLRELSINGCLGCEGCKKQLGRCVQKDDLTPLLQEMAAADAIVLGAPVYWYQVAAQFKILVDRLYSFFSIETDPDTGKQKTKSAFPAGKKIIIVLSRGDDEPTPVLPHFYKYLDEWISIIPASLGASSSEIFHQYGAHLDRKSATNDETLLEKARQAGKGLV